MRELRFERKLSLQAIGDMYGVSRERVRQLIGNSGKRYGGFNSQHEDAKKRRVAIRSYPHLTNAELSAELKISVQTIVKHRSNTRHAIDSNNLATMVGIQYEELASTVLTEEGMPNKLMPFLHPFDILTDLGVRIDVKGATRTINNTPSRKKRGGLLSPMWRFQIRTNVKVACDFFLCCIPSGEIFVIPAKSVPRAKFIHFCYPTLRPEIGKYQKYLNAFHLIKEYNG